MVHAIGDALADEVGQLLDQVGILQQDGAAGPTVSEYSSLATGQPASVVVLVVDCSSLSPLVSPLVAVDLASTWVD